MNWRWLGRLDHAAAMAEQEGHRARLLAGDRAAACLLLVEHEPVITLGRRARREHIVASAAELAELGIAVCTASRGGEVTYHGPGQLVIYPVVRLTGGVVAFLAALAGALAEVAAELGVPGSRWQREPAGLWLGRAKLAACGIHIHRRVTGHGFALNIATPAPPGRPDPLLGLSNDKNMSTAERAAISPWRLIVPCGLSDRPVTSLARERAARGLPPPPDTRAVAERAAPRLCAALRAVSDFA
ncbi:MAG: lipoyl(octanoyl) transferase LipB [Myxococcota bacterium]